MVSIYEAVYCYYLSNDEDKDDPEFYFEMYIGYMKYFLYLNVDINAADFNGQTALMLVSIPKGAETFRNFLIELILFLWIR